MKLHSWIFIFAVTLLTSNAFSQSRKKATFNLIVDKTTNNQDLIETAISNFSDLDRYRFYGKRRRILIQNTGVTVELLSALELKEKFDKQISPFTIMPGSEYSGVEFYITDDAKKTLVPLIQKNQVFTY